MELLNTGDLKDYKEEDWSNWIQLAIWERLINDHWDNNEFKQLFEKNKKSLY